MAHKTQRRVNPSIHASTHQSTHTHTDVCVQTDNNMDRGMDNREEGGSGQAGRQAGSDRLFLNTQLVPLHSLSLSLSLTRWPQRMVSCTVDVAAKCMSVMSVLAVYVRLEQPRQRVTWPWPCTQTTAACPGMPQTTQPYLVHRLDDRPACPPPSPYAHAPPSQRPSCRHPSRHRHQ